MKKYILTILSASLLGFSACSEDKLDEINVDNLHPSPDAVPAYLQLSEAIMSTGFSTISGDYSFYLSSLTEQEIGVGNNQLAKAELRNSVEWAGTTTFNNVWVGTYGNLTNIREMIRKVENEIPGNTGYKNLLGIAQVLEALSFGILTDLHGDIPYSEALKGQEILQPKLDAQKDVYAGIMATLDKAIANLTTNDSQTSAMIKDQDLAFQGDINQWLATAYALKARYSLHQLAVNSSMLADAKSAALKAVELGFEGCSITEFNGVNCDNPWSAFHWSRSYTASSKTVTKLMEATDDPRLGVYTYWTGEASEPGDEEDAKVADGSLAYPAWLDLGYQPIHIFSLSELYFILAETQLRSGEDATDAFQTAVEASVSEILGWFPEEEDLSVVEPFVESLGTPTLKTLFEQKYLAQCVDEQIETYNDIRRLEAMGESYISLTNPHNTQSGINRFPYCLPYGNSSVSSNTNVQTAYGDGSYLYKNKTWINGGN